MGTDADRPLAGIGVAVTRDEDAHGPLSEALAARGATVLSWRAVRQTSTRDSGPLAAAVRGLADYDWLVFTSPRAVAAVGPATDHVPGDLRVAAVGEATAAAARDHGWSVDLVPTVQTAVALVDALARADVGPGSRVLFPASEIAGRTLEDGLAAVGARVERVTAYRTVPVAPDRAACLRALDHGTVHVITFTSPSAVAGLRNALGMDAFRAAAEQVVVAAIGPTTAAAVRAAGARHLIEARDHSLPGLVERIEEWARAEEGAE